MKVSVNWLKDHVTINIPMEKLAHRLVMAGLEVENIEAHGDDAVFELEVTPNRPDCLNVLGIAREVSAILDKPLKLPRVKKSRLPAKRCEVEVLDREGCGRYIGTLIRGVSVGAAPEWMTTRLSSLGLRSINNVVDITNFSLMENGQPLHAFDHDKLIGGKVIVRRARAGEKIVTIDGVERTLDPSILVIADAQRPVAIAGIMGGKDTEVTSSTKNILLESAYFHPILVRRAGRKLGLSTDSSYRFERNVDIARVEDNAQRALALILELAGGKVESRVDIFQRKRKFVARQVVVSRGAIEKRLGSKVTTARCKIILKKLDFKVRFDGRDTLRVTPPSSRNDVRIPEDIVEEIARVIGYDNLDMQLPTVAMDNIPTHPVFQAKKDLRRTLTGLGLDEAITYSMVSRQALERSGITEPAVKVINPLSLEQELMRPSLLPSLLACVRSNFNRGEKRVRLFEIGRVYPADGERDTLGVVLTGPRQADWRIADRAAADIYDAKAVLEQTIARFADPSTKISFEPLENGPFTPGEAARVIVDGKACGQLGRMSRDVLLRWDIKHETVVFAQLDLERLYTIAPVRKQFRALPEFPAVGRDISIAAPHSVSFEQVQDLARAAAGDLLKSIHFLELYTGDKIPPGHRGLVFSLVYQAPDRTLTEDEVNRAHDKVCRGLKDELRAVLR